MFNDELTKEQCQTLVSRLAECKFPFQCAHGRPSLVPLVDVGRVDMRVAAQERSGNFGAAFNRWKGNTSRA
jgi:DNA mismatch repair protein MLH3